MPSPTSTQGLQVIADLTVNSPQGNIRIDNDSEGNLIINFPNQKAFFSMLNTKLPFRANWSTIIQTNRSFYRNQQPLVVKVNGRPWVTLGKHPRPRINYQRVAYPFISSTPSLKTALYILVAAVGVTLLYSLFRRRS